MTGNGVTLDRTFGNGALKVFRRGDGVSHVLIDRPPVNAMDEAAYLGLRDCFEELSFDAPTRAVVLSASGDRAFVAGTDVRDFANQHQDDPAWAGRHARKAHSAFHAIFRCSRPVIAAVRSATLGSGIGIVASCDAVLAAPDATFGLPEINVGVLGGANFLMRLVSPQQARIMQYTGRRLTAVEMAPYGAVQVVEDPESAALELAAEIASKSPTAIRLAKEGFNHLELGKLSLFEGYTYEQTLTERLSATKEANGASSAFLAHRSS
jgi:enoyl-CoA hydratase/carnithine racemase